jgi:hypothetical protein
MSSPVALMSAAAVALAGLGFVLTGHSATADHAQLAAAPPTSTPVERPVKMHARHHAPVVHRDQVYVSVYNNSSITGLAGATAQRIGALGWKVVGSDNWYGTIPATTIYYPSGMERAGRLLAQDLGVQRVMPSVAPMSTDRLTVILTADFG